jgi:hypothetical protein
MKDVSTREGLQAVCFHAEGETASPALEFQLLLQGLCRPRVFLLVFLIPEALVDPAQSHPHRPDQKLKPMRSLWMKL